MVGLMGLTNIMRVCRRMLGGNGWTEGIGEKRSRVSCRARRLVFHAPKGGRRCRRTKERVGGAG